jgi:hypothetical protein
VEAVFTKLSVGLKRLPATELGPLVYQLLKLLKVLYVDILLKIQIRVPLDCS